MKNDSTLIQHNYSLSPSPIRSSMSKAVIYRANKQFNKYAEFFQNTLHIQDHDKESSNKNFKPSLVRENSLIKQQQYSSNVRLNKGTLKPNAAKFSTIKSNTNNNSNIDKHRLSSSPHKSLHSGKDIIFEKPAEIKNRLSANKLVKPVPRFPHSNKTKITSSSPIPNIQSDDDLVRSSSCGDIPSLKLSKKRTNYIRDQFLIRLKRIQTISKQIRIKNSSTNYDTECFPLWNELEKCLSSIISSMNDEKLFQSSLMPLQNEINELRKELKATNIHLHEYDLIHRRSEQNIDLQKKFNTDHNRHTRLLLHNNELQSKCRSLQDKLENSEKNNIRLIQRLTHQDLRSITHQIELNSPKTNSHLNEEICFLKNKLYHVYDDVSILFNRNHKLELSIQQHKRQLLLYNQKFQDLKQGAQNLLNDINDYSVEEKIKSFVSKIVIDQSQFGIWTDTNYKTPMKPVSQTTDSNNFHVKTPHKTSNPQLSQPVTSQSQSSSIMLQTNLRPKSLFVTPTVLNDSKILSKFKNNQTPFSDLTDSSSSTIADADSILTSSTTSSKCPKQNQTMVYSDLQVPARQHIDDLHGSSQEMDLISDLTSKMFSSQDEEDILIGDTTTSTSSSL